MRSRRSWGPEIVFNRLSASLLPRLKICAMKGFLKLEKGKDWERKATSVPGIFILKLPPYRNSPSQIAAEINPLDSSGNPTKKRGLILRNSLELKEFRKLVNEGKLTC